MLEIEETRPENRSTRGTVALLLAALVCVALLFGLCGEMAFVFVLDKPDEAKWTKAQTEMGEIQKALNRYAVDHKGAYPVVLSDVAPAFGGDIPKDPFSKVDYIYTRTADGFTLTCLGKDLITGGAQIPERDIVFTEIGFVEP